MEFNADNNPGLIIIILTIGIFAILNTEMGVVGIIPDISKYFNVSIAMAGLFVSLFALVLTFTSFFMPLLFSRFSRRKCMILSLIVFIILSSIMAFVENFYLALTLRVILAFFHPLFCAYAFAMGPEVAGSANSSRASSILLMGVSGGMALGISISAYLTSLYGYHVGMLWFIIPDIIALIGVIFFLPDIPRKNETSMTSQVSILRSSVFVISVLAVIVCYTGHSVAYAYISEFLQTITGLVSVSLTITLFIYGAMSFIGNFIGGWCITHNPSRTAITSPIILGLVLIGLYLVGKSFIPTFIFVALFGLMYGVVNVMIQYWIVSSAPEAPELANGIFMSATNIAYALGGFIGGFVIMDFGSASIMIVAFIILILSVFVFKIRTIKYPSY